jgi:hypothetical protein
MDVLHPKCCGLDVHKSSISACILLHEAGRVQKHQRRFGAMTQELQELAEWLRQFNTGGDCWRRVRCWQRNRDRRTGLHVYGSESKPERSV